MCPRDQNASRVWSKDEYRNSLRYTCVAPCINEKHNRRAKENGTFSQGWIIDPWLIASKGVLSSAPCTCFSGCFVTPTFVSGTTITHVAEGAIFKILRIQSEDDTEEETNNIYILVRVWRPVLSYDMYLSGSKGATLLKGAGCAECKNGESVRELPESIIGVSAYSKGSPLVISFENMKYRTLGNLERFPMSALGMRIWLRTWSYLTYYMYVLMNCGKWIMETQ